VAKKSALSKSAKEFISSKIKRIMYEYDKTGMIGKSKPTNRNAALRQAIAVAFSMAKREGFKVPKRAEEYHSEVFALEEEVYNLLNTCNERGYHRFEPNPQFDINNVVIDNFEFADALFDNFDDVYLNLGEATLYAQIYEGQPCLDCGAVIGDNGWDEWGFTWPNNPEIIEERDDTGEPVSELMEYGPHSVCEACGEKKGGYYGDPDEHGIGRCVPEQEIKCDICGEEGVIGEYFTYTTIEDWNNSHGEGLCVPIKKGDFTILKKPQFNFYPRDFNNRRIDYATVEDYEKIHGGENPLSQDGRIYALTVKEIDALERSMDGDYFTGPRGIASLRKSDKIERLGVIEEPKIIQKTVKTPLNVKSIKAYLAKLQKTDPDKHDEVMEDLFGAEGLTVDTYRIQDSFVRDVFTYPYTPHTSRTTTMLGGESVYFKEGRIHGYVLRKNEKSMDILINGFTGVAYFTKTKERITSGEKLKGKVALNIDNRFIALYDDEWREDAQWTDSDKHTQQESWQLDWDSEEYDLDKMNSMTMVEKIFITSAIGLCFLVGNKRE
jgi:hypothetical protein